MLKSLNTEEYWSLFIGLLTFGLVYIATYFNIPIPSVNLWNNSPRFSTAILIGYLVLIIYTLLILTITQLILGKIAHWQYLIILAISILASLAGSNLTLHSWGLGSSVWCILGGILLRNCVKNSKDIFDGVAKMEFLIKISIVLLAIDLNDIRYVGGYGIIVAWGETIFTIFCILIIGKILKFNNNENIMISCGTSICGSSAAMTIASITMVDSAKLQLFITIMSLLTIPLIPTLPLMRKVFNDNLVGTLIGGCVDSTGAVIASGSLGSKTLLHYAIVIKMLQNLLIGPTALVVATIWTQQCRPILIWEKFPKFVIGFIITAVITTFTPAEGISMNSFAISEWFSSLSFVMIGFDVDLNDFNFADGKKILLLYVVGQTIDIGMTFIAAYLLFR